MSTEPPWAISEVRTIDGHAMVVGGEGRDFGLVAECIEDDDARLIAAAPELLEALRLVLPLAKGYGPEGQTRQARRTCDEWIAAAEDAIAKAEAPSQDAGR